MKKNNKILTLILVLALSAALLMGCAPVAQTALQTEKPAAQISDILVQSEQLTGGVLCLKINPEIALHYDENGKVTKLEARNADGTRILEGITGYEGKETTAVLEELVNLIGKAGYFVEEAEGKARKIVLELDPGSNVPHEAFLQDMAAHVKLCVENKNWMGEADYEYDKAIAPTEAAQTTVPTQAVISGTTSPTVPSGLCPVCGDDDCDDGKYCDDADEKAENLREAEAKAKAKSSSAKSAATKSTSGKSTSTKSSSTSTTVPSGLCPVCGDDDCDDGKYCDDADEKAENLREAENRKNGTPCAICGDYDCDDGKYCDDADEKAENLREEENRKNGTPCTVCGDYDCDDGKFCDDWDDRYDDHHDD